MKNCLDSLPATKLRNLLPILAACGMLFIGRASIAQSGSRTGHWAFQSPVMPIVPHSSTINGRQPNPVDAFLLSALKSKKLAFSSPASRRTLLRRVTYDLIGLPPTPEETEAFLADNSPNAYEMVVDRLLSDPRFGENWARNWLDTAGYADSEGILQEDRIRPNAWRYRDYVIRSLNSDKPYDQFLREQIAGDEMVDYRNSEHWTPEIEEAITATGFLRTAVDATRDDFNTHQFTEYQNRMLNDTQTILISSTLGITLQCARCHDHKYEPFTQKDYYGVQALLRGAIRPEGKLLPTNRRQIVAATASEEKKAKTANDMIDATVKEIDQSELKLLADFRKRFLESKLNTVTEEERALLIVCAQLDDAHRSPQQKALALKYKSLLEPTPETLSIAFPEFGQKRTTMEKARADEIKKRVTFPEIRALYDQDANPPPSHLLIRGEWTRPGEIVEPSIPAVLNSTKNAFVVPSPQPGSNSTGRRRALAEWITRPGNPLTSRVMVNRIWAQLFGIGIVATPENFGKSGAPPTNQPLLDWLAVSFEQGINGGKPWKTKTLIRLIVSSAVYRQSSSNNSSTAKLDPENRLLWRQRPRRISAESMRDAMLSASGMLDSKMYGESVGEEARATGEIVPLGEENQGRRSIYLQVRRSLPITLLNTFDEPVMETNCTRRTVSTTAGQSLALLNSNFVASMARHFARRVMKTAPDLPLSPLPEDAQTTRFEAGIDYAYRLAHNRPSSAAERIASLSFLQAQKNFYKASGKPANLIEELVFTDFCHALLSSNEFIYLD